MLSCFESLGLNCCSVVVLVAEYDALGPTIKFEFHIPEIRDQPLSRVIFQC